ASGSGRRRSAVGELVALDRRTAIAPRLGQDLDRTSRGGDGCFSALREGVGLHGDGAGQLTTTEDLHEGTLVGQPLGVEGLRRDLVELGRLDDVQVDGLVLDPERVVEALELRDAHVERHLAALEPGRDGAARPLALGAAAGGLAALARDAPADALLALVRAGG